MRILVLIVQFPPDVNSSGLLMAQVCQGLCARGHRVNVITTFPHYAEFRIRDEYRGKLFERRRFRGMGILRLWVYASGTKDRMLNRLMSYLSFSALAAIAGLLSRDTYDIILCSNGAFFTGIAASVIGAARRIPFVYNVQDLYPETPVQAGQLRNKLAVAVLEHLERYMYRRAAHVSVIAQGFKDNIVGKGLPADHVSVIPNFVDSAFIRPLPKHNEFRAQHALTDKFVVTHAGNLGYVYDFETLMDAAAQLRTEDDVVFLIVGDGVMRQRLEDKAQRMGLANIRFLAYQPRETLPLLRAASDVHLALYRSGSARYSMPSKVYEIMASSRPVLASAEVGTDLWRLVTDTRCGICVPPQSPRNLAAAIRALRADPRLCALMGERGRAEVERTYSPDAVVTRYDELLRATAEHRAPAPASRLPEPGGTRAWESSHLPHAR